MAEGAHPGIRVEGAGFRVEGLQFRVHGTGLRVQGLGFRVQGAGFMVQGSGHRVPTPTGDAHLNPKRPPGSHASPYSPFRPSGP